MGITPSARAFATTKSVARTRGADDASKGSPTHQTPGSPQHATMIVVTNEELEALGTEDVLEADDGDD